MELAPIIEFGPQSQSEIDGFEYRFFTNPIERRDIFDACKRASEYSLENEISNIVFIDRAARPMWVGISEYFKIHYPDQKVPNMFFVNPDGFYRPIAGLFDRGLVKRKLEEQHPYLVQHKDEPVMLVDNCVHSGRTSHSVAKGLFDAGFKDGHFVVMQDVDNFSRIEPHEVFLKDRLGLAAGGCYTFGRVNTVEHNRNEVVSDPSPDDVSADVAQIRREIKKIIRAGEGVGENIDYVRRILNLASIALGLPDCMIASASCVKISTRSSRGFRDAR